MQKGQTHQRQAGRRQPQIAGQRPPRRKCAFGSRADHGTRRGLLINIYGWRGSGLVRVSHLYPIKRRSNSSAPITWNRERLTVYPMKVISQYLLVLSLMYPETERML